MTTAAPGVYKKSSNFVDHNLTGNDELAGKYDSFTRSIVKTSRQVNVDNETKMTEKEVDPEINLGMLNQCVKDQIVMREEISVLASLCAICFAVIFVLIEQLDTTELYATATSAANILGNAGDGAGMDENSLEAVMSEANLWHWLREGLVPMVSDKQWFKDPVEFRADYGVRQNCNPLMRSGESCQQQFFPNYTEQTGDGDGYFYDRPYDDQFTRKYNLLIGGIKIEQKRAPYSECPNRGFLAGHAGYQVSSFAPGFKCYQEAESGAFKLLQNARRYYNTGSSMPAHLEFENLWPRAHKEHTELFKLEYPNSTVHTRYNSSLIEFSGPTLKFPHYFEKREIFVKAQGLLRNCLEQEECRCKGGAAIAMAAAFNTQMVSTGRGAYNISAEVARVSTEVFVPSGAVLSYMPGVDLDIVRKECLDSVMGLKKKFLVRTFEPDDDKYAIYLDVTASSLVLGDILRFAQAHGWIDLMTRQIVTTYSNYNANTNTFTATRVKCYFETGGAVWCKGGVEVLRVGHYDGWKMTALIRLVMEVLIVLSTVYLAFNEVMEVRLFQTDTTGTVLSFEEDDVNGFVYEVRMGSGSILPFPEDQIRRLLTPADVEFMMNRIGFDPRFIKVFAASPAKELFCESITVARFAKHAKLTKKIKKRDKKKQKGLCIFFIMSGEAKAFDSKKAYGQDGHVRWSGEAGMVLATGHPYSTLQESLMRENIYVKAQTAVECLQLNVNKLAKIAKIDPELVAMVKELAASLDGAHKGQELDAHHAMSDHGSDLGSEESEEEEEINEFSLAQKVKLKTIPGLGQAVQFYWRDYRNILDWLMIGMIWLCCFVWGLLVIRGEELDIKAEYDLDRAPEELTKLIDLLEDLTNWFRFYRIFAGMLSIVLVLKIIVATGFFPPVKVVINTLSYSVSKVTYFMMIFLLFMAGFAICAHVAAGQSADDFSTFKNSMSSCLDILVGSYDPDAIFAKRSPNLALLVFFYIYNIMMVWVMINVFVAIVSDAYAQAKGEYEESVMKVLIERFGPSPFTWIVSPWEKFDEKAGYAFIDDINRIIEGNVSELRVNDSKYDDNEDDADPEVVSGETLDGSVRVSHVLIKDWFVRRPLTFAKDPETGEFCPVGTLPASLVSQLFRLHTDPKCRRNWRSWKKLSWTIIGDADYKGEDDKGDVTVFGWPVNKRIPEKVMHTCTVQTSGEYNAEAFEISADSPEMHDAQLANKMAQMNQNFATLQREDSQLFALSKYVSMELQESIDSISDTLQTEVWAQQQGNLNYLDSFKRTFAALEETAIEQTKDAARRGGKAR